MNEDINLIQENDFFVIKLNASISTLKLLWKENAKLNISKFKEGIIAFANANEEFQIQKAVIDARNLNQNGNPSGWVTGQKSIEGLESYNIWWEREIVPIYNQAEILGIGVATGDPNAPGEIPSPEVADFKIAYFTNIDDVFNWKLN